MSFKVKIIYAKFRRRQKEHKEMGTKVKENEIRDRQKCGQSLKSSLAYNIELNPT